MARKQHPMASVIRSLSEAGSTGPEIREKLLGMGQNIPLRTIQQYLALYPATSPPTVQPTSTPPDPAWPAWGDGQSEAVLATAYRELFTILGDPFQQPAHRIKAGETLGQLSILGAELERSQKPKGG